MGNGAWVGRRSVAHGFNFYFAEMMWVILNLSF